MNDKAKHLTIWGLVLQLGYFLAALVTVKGMVRAFMEVSQNGEIDLEVLAANMRLALIATAAGSLLSYIGAILLFIVLFGLKYRECWFRNVMIALGVLWLFSVPVGTICGVVALVYLWSHRQEFKEVTSGEPK